MLPYTSKERKHILWNDLKNEKEKSFVEYGNSEISLSVITDLLVQI